MRACVGGSEADRQEIREESNSLELTFMEFSHQLLYELPHHVMT